MAKSYVRGNRAKAAVSLLDELRRRGIVGAEVGYLFDPKSRVLIVKTTAAFEGDRGVPPTWQGFSVRITPPER